MIFSGYLLEAQGPYSSMSQEQLNFALARANRKINTGTTLTFAGVAVEIAGIVIVAKGWKGLEEAEFGTGELWIGSVRLYYGTIVMAGGLGLMGSGIPIWAVGSAKRKKIEFELMKFNPPGTASAYGVGITIRF